MSISLAGLAVADDESPHPMIDSAFLVNYEGFLVVACSGANQSAFQTLSGEAPENSIRIWDFCRIRYGVTDESRGRIDQIQTLRGKSEHEQNSVTS
jgi:hypothetical protein